jgi:aminoglycoside phosphotransferase (APT) family kinase protein
MTTRSEQLDTLAETCHYITSRSHLTPAATSSRGFTFFVATEAEDDTPAYVVKLAKISDDDAEAGEIYRTALPPEATAISKLAIETTILTRLATTAVPVPDVVSSVTEPGREMPPHILMEYSEGSVLSEMDSSLSPTQRERVIEHVGRYIAQVHDVFSFDRFGELGVSNGTLGVPDGDQRWQDRFETDIEQALARLEQTPLADVAPPARDWYHAHRAALDQQFEATVIHADLNPLNILVTTTDSDPAISAIIDWEDSLAGPPELQIASAVTLLDRQLPEHETATVRDRFTRGYRSVRALPADYEQRLPLYAFRQWLQTFSNLQPDLDTADGRGAAVTQHARTAFEEIVET